ncbi:MAG TPA: APC family permease [Rhabdochlamydiaceae bacterium]|jgi:putative glutamate/gamma-aminobutyrate antiporter|nr:APC family permease [Rhabdochlamydiaceae bacterium]
MTKKISFYSLVILIIAAIDSIRNLPAAALFGSSMIFFFVFSALVFLIPTAFVAAELSATFPEKGGVYHWVRTAFGEKWAMLAIWLQWINTMAWYPTILSFIAGTAAYLINPELAQNKAYLVTFILIVFWTLTLINLKGLHVSALINNICATIGTVIPMLFLITLGIIWVCKGQPLQIYLSSDTLIPSLSQSTNWISLIAIMASFLGMELSGVHVNDIHNPQKNFPRAVLLASFFIFATMLLGSLAIAFVLPEKSINLVSGVMQVFSNFFEVFGIRALTPILTLMIVIGSIGSITNWLISPAKGLLHAAEFGFLPAFFTKKNKAGVASHILLAQAILVSLFCLIFLLVPSVNAFYWFLTALSTELYMIMYILMFCSAVKLHYSYSNRPAAFKIPGKHWGMWITALLGLFGCTTTIIVSFFPPGNVDIGSASRYLSMICIGNLVTLSPVLLFYLYKRKQTLKKIL